jgi:DNA-directed RNA polymerase subunit RPC12/RpoP
MNEEIEVKVKVAWIWNCPECGDYSVIEGKIPYSHECFGCKKEFRLIEEEVDNYEHSY